MSQHIEMITALELLLISKLLKINSHQKYHIFYGSIYIENKLIYLSLKNQKPGIHENFNFVFLLISDGEFIFLKNCPFL